MAQYLTIALFICLLLVQHAKTQVELLDEIFHNSAPHIANSNSDSDHVEMVLNQLDQNQNSSTIRYEPTTTTTTVATATNNDVNATTTAETKRETAIINILHSIPVQAGLSQSPYQG